MKLLLATAIIAAVFAAPAAANPFDSLRWEKRLLLIFGETDGAQEAEQRRLLPEKELAARDLLVVTIPRDGKLMVPGQGSLDAAGARKAYGIAADAGFEVLLVGKDGGVKMRAKEPIQAKELFSTVDAMPMRRQEARG
ncbi:DUF4174 domain-containing protein [Aureimonas psammosilenae]|uniref:DUF4174 domain-containing protein n=1 Tax=Aureimonas psammosilenae TaxID=2495496 RepID=UPI00186A9C28|nr:DUF4174 domain-containing protein [Aureimonas psammosilenae]